jgi:hypothetical protein
MLTNVHSIGQCNMRSKAVKYHQNLSTGRRVVVPQTDGRMDMTKLMVAFHNFANMPKNKTSQVLTLPRIKFHTIFYTYMSFLDKYCETDTCIYKRRKF